MAARGDLVIWAFFVFSCWPVARAEARPAYLDHWVERLEKRVADADKRGVLSEDKREELYDSVRRVKRMRDEALRDSIVTVSEREAIRQVIGGINMEIAEARFGPHEQVAVADPEQQRRRALLREPNDEAGTSTVKPAF